MAALYVSHPREKKQRVFSDSSDGSALDDDGEVTLKPQQSLEEIRKQMSQAMGKT